MNCPVLQKLTDLPRECIKSFFNSFDTVLSDCDGVLWLENKVIEGSPNVLNKFQEVGKKVFFVTNNSTKMRSEYVKKAQDMGYNSSVDQIVSTSYLTAKYLKSINFNKKIYVIGSKGITQELDQVGIKHIGTGPDTIQTNLSKTMENIKLDPEVGAVVVGFDEHFSYPKMVKAACYLNNPDCMFLATNKDERFPIEGNIVLPGTGSIVSAVETSAGRNPIIIGKPHSIITEVLMKDFKINPKKTLMIGDKCSTDILLGTRCGFKTLLVLTGVTSLSEVDKYAKSDLKEEQEFVPNFYVEKLGDILPFIN